MKPEGQKKEEYSVLGFPPSACLELGKKVYLVEEDWEKNCWSHSVAPDQARLTMSAIGRRDPLQSTR